jgi:hypothetical protein
VILIPEHDIPRGMRDLVAEDFARIVHLKGIIVAASKPRIKATSMMLQCKVESRTGATASCCASDVQCATELPDNQKHFNSTWYGSQPDPTRL